jgi:hypothetical protein
VVQSCNCLHFLLNNCYKYSSNIELKKSPSLHHNVRIYDQKSLFRVSSNCLLLSLYLLNWLLYFDLVAITPLTFCRHSCFHGDGFDDISSVVTEKLLF